LGSGEKYVGSFIRGRFDGLGILYSPEGEILKKGLWRDDVFIGSE
jgi:hypothetical protein